MPNTGKPSKDCHTCRKRRVKCTLERPECQRCLRIGSRCPGYRDQQDLMFRNEDISSLGGSSARRDRRRARSNASSDRETSRTPPQVAVPCDWSVRGIKLRDLDPMLFDTTASSSICPIPLNRWSQYALPLVLALFSYEEEGRREFNQLQTLASLVMKCPDYSPLAMCCEALGIAYLANRFPSTEADTMRDQAYIQALAATNGLVGDHDLCQQHEAPMSVWLLSLYEVIVGSQRMADGSSTVTWGIHAQGSVELLRLRGPNQLDTSAGRSIFFLLAASTQIRTMITGEDYPAFIQDWLLASRDRLSAPALEFFYLSSFASDTANIATQAREALATDDIHFLSWTTTDLWTRVLALQVTLDQALQSHPLEEPVDMENLHITNQYRTFYIRALQHMLELVEAKQFTSGNGLSPEQNARISLSVRNMMRGLIDEVLSTASLIVTSMPAKQGHRTSLDRDTSKFTRPVYWCDVLKQLWPLRILNSRKYFLTDDQIRCTESMLRCLSEDFCIKQALAVYHPIDIASGK